MKHVFSISCVAFLSLLMLVTSCKKGDTGPIGPEGPQGPQGAQGPKGDTGVANVIYSAWLDVGYTTIYDTADNGDIDSFYVGGMDAPKLTAAIATRGDVRTYINFAATDEDPLVMALPYGTEIFSFFEPGFIYLQAASNWSTRLYNDGAKDRQYRYILIPGGVQARSAIDWNNYAAVKEYLKLPD